jgi:hypothetical protein
MIKLVMPCRGEFGLKMCHHVPAVNALEGSYIVICEKGEQALYPNAYDYDICESAKDDNRRGLQERDEEFTRRLLHRIAHKYHGYEVIEITEGMPRRFQVFEPTRRQDITCDVVICPRFRRYGASKNWPHWPVLADHLKRLGLKVFAAGKRETSVLCDVHSAWNYPGHELDATLEAMESASVVVATDAGLAHLAVQMGKPLVLITYRDLVAPGPVLDPDGKELAPKYWEVNWQRYTEQNHAGSTFMPLYAGWEDTALVAQAANEFC